MSQALTQYHALYESVRSRRVRPVIPRGLDLVAARAGMMLRHARTRRAFLGVQARAADAHAHELHSYSEAALDDEIGRVREVFRRARQDDGAVARALALVREVARRATGEEAYPVQLLGALALYHGRVIEMLTGEGKTLTGSLAAPLIAWQRRHLHVFTVNDYLATRDAESRRPIYRRCLVDCGAVTHEMSDPERARVYALGIVYGTPKQIVADWLRDQIKLGRATTAWSARSRGVLPDLGAGGDPMIPGLHAALIDEADAVMIDEGVVPLIIARSRSEDRMAPVYREAAVLAGRLDEGPDYAVDHVARRVDLRPRGRHRCAAMFEELLDRGGSPIWRASRRGEELVRQALVARHCYIHGQQYQIVDGKVVIVDEYTGRFLADRSWEHGLHQAVEAKEGLEVTADRETLARMSFQRFYRSYPFLCGMTGTAADATGEIERVYSRPVTIVPTNRPMIRARWPMRAFRTQREKWSAIVESIADVNRQGRPILVGTRSIAKSEMLSALLSRRGIEHRVLNAHHDKEEAALIARAGEGSLPSDGAGSTPAAVTVATNMAGRGTDIKLDLAARRAGGLHVILTEMHGAERIDRQFIGRAGRQGDPGSSQVFVSLEDELLRRFAPRLAVVLEKLYGGPEIPGTGLVRLAFLHAQRRSQRRDRINRAGVLRHDDWVDKHLPGAG